MKLVFTSVPFAVVLAAQTPTPQLTYDVVSIKPNNSLTLANRISRGPATGGRFTATNVSLQQLIIIAYGSANAVMGADVSLVGAPSWITDRYDVDAKPPSGLVPNPKQTQEMLQALLRERFALQVHHETKTAPVYELVVDAKGVRMKKSADQTPNDGASPAGATSGDSLPRGRIMTASGQIRAAAIPISFLINPLIAQSGRQVIDRTNLDGLFDVELKFAPNLGLDAQSPDGLPSLFTALQEQLGLRLTPATGPMDVIVIEHVDRPTAN